MIQQEFFYQNELDLQFETAKTALLASESEWKVSGDGKVYYVSPNGNDANDGLSEAKAWKTLAKVNSATLSSGSVVLFERGGVWNLQGSLKMQAGVTYSAYGSGDKPLISNCVEANLTSDWTNVGENLWVYSGSYQSGLVDEYPNDTAIPGSYLTSTNYDNAANNDIGCIIFNDGEGWGVKITKTTENNSVDLGTCLTGFGQIDCNSFPFVDEKDLKDELTFYHNPDTSRLYLYCRQNPADAFQDIKFVVRGYGVGGSADNTTLDNLAIKYFGAHGISVGSAKNFTVRNCELGWLGGSIQTYDFGGRNYPTRFGEGIQNWGKCDGFYVRNCWIYQVYDGAVSSQQSTDNRAQTTIMKDIQVTDCLLEYNSMSVEMWQTMTVDQAHKPDRFGFEGMRVTGNLFRNIGYGFGTTRPGFAIYEDEACGMTTGDGYYGCWYGIRDCIISDNIMWNSRRQFISGQYWSLETGYQLYGNTFLAEYGSNFGMLPTDFDNLATWGYSKYAYTDKVIGDLFDRGIVGVNNFYFLCSAE